MRTGATKYCLDANVLIEAWHKYYSPAFCPDYWEILAELGKKEIVFLPESVYDEITRTEDELAGWLKADKLPVLKISEPVTICLKKIYSVNPKHRQLVDSAKARSLADPWLIAHAIHESATVVTKEEKVTALNAKRIKIPNVCDNLGVRCINDFQLINELSIKFKCSLI
jgi:hypothetical protein